MGRLRKVCIRSSHSPHSASLSNSITRWAAKPIRTKGDLLVGHRGDPRVRVACPTQPYSGSPRWQLTGPPAPDSWRSLRRAGQRPPTPSPGTRPISPAEFAEFGLDPVELFSEPATDFRAQFGRKILFKGPPTTGGFGNANRGPD